MYNQLLGCNSMGQEIAMDRPPAITSVYTTRERTPEEKAAAAHAANVADHIGRYRADPAQFARDTIAHANTITDPTGKANYFTAINQILSQIPAGESQALLAAALAADFWTAWEFMNYALPEFNEVSHIWYIQNKPDQFWESAIAHVNTLTTDEAKAAYIEAIRGFAEKAGDTWKTQAKDATLQNVLPIFYEPEIQAASAAAAAAAKMKNAKLIGFAVLGVFAIFALSKMTGKGKPAPVIVAK